MPEIREGRERLTQRAVGDVCTLLRTLIGIKLTFLGALIGVTVHMSSTLPGTRGNEFGGRSWGKGSTPFTVSVQTPEQ